MLNYGGFGLGLIFTARDLATKTMRDVDRELRTVSLTADAASRRFDASMRLMRTGLASLGIGAAIAGPLTLVGKAAFDTSTQFKQITKTFEVFLGSAERATQHVEELQKFAETTPFEFLDLTQYSRQLQAYGFQVQEIIPMLTAAGDAAAAMQDPLALERLIRSLGQVRAKGRLVGEELLQMAEIGLPVYQILQEQLGLTAEQIGKIADQGIPAQKAIDAILTGLTKRYGGMMAELMKTPQGILSNMRDMLTRLRRGIGDVFYDEVVAVLQNALRTLASLGSEGVMKGIGEGFRGVVAVVKPVVDAVFGLVRGVAKFVEQRPWVASFAVTLAGVSAIVFMLAGSFLFLRGVIGVIPMLLQKIGMSGRFAIGSLAWPVLVATMAITGLRFAVERNIGGIGTLWRGLATLISNTRFDPQTGWVSALPEALRNELQRLNLLDFAVKVWMFTVRAREFLQGFVEGVRGFVKGVRGALQPIGTAFLDVARAVVAPFVRSGVDLTKTASGLPIKSFRDFGVQMGQAFERALPFIRGFASGVAMVIRTVGAVLGPTVRVVTAAFRLLGEIISWVINRFARSGRELPTDKISILGKAIGGLVGMLLTLKGAAVLKFAFIGGIQALLGSMNMLGRMLAGLPTTIGQVGLFFGQLAARMSMFDPGTLVGTLVARVQRMGGVLSSSRGYFATLMDSIRFAIQGMEGFAQSLARNSVRVARFGLDLVQTGVKAAGRFVAGIVQSGSAILRNFLPGIDKAIASARALASALLANPVTWIIAGVIALGTATYLLWKNWDRVTGAVGRAWTKIREFAGGLSPVAATALAVFMPLIGIPLLIVRNWDRIRVFFAKLGPAIKVIWTAVHSWFMALPGQIVSWFRSLPEILASIVKKVLFGAFFAMLLVFYGIPLLIVKNWDKIMGFFASLWATIVRGGTAFLSWIAALPARIWGWLTGLLSQIGTVLASAWSVITGWAANAAKFLWVWVTQIPAQIGAGIAGAWRNLIASLPGIWVEIVKFFESLPSRALEWGKALITSFIEGIKSAIGSIGNIAKEAAGAVKRFLGIESPAEAGPLATSHLWGPNLAQMFAQGLRKGLPLVTAASVELASALSGAFAGASPAVPAPIVPAVMPSAPAVAAAEPVTPRETTVIAAVPARARPSMPTTPLVRPVIVQVPVETSPGKATVPVSERPQPEIIQLVVDGRVLAEVVRNVEREDLARSAPW